MKRVFYTLFAVMFVVFFSAIAQDDTLVVQPDVEGIGALNRAVQGDTLPDGNPVNPNRVYKLLRGSRYLVDGRVSTKAGFHLRLVGEPAPATGTDYGPAVIQAAPRSEGGTDDRFFDIYGDVTLKNIWFLYWATNDARPWKPMMWRGEGASAVVYVQMKSVRFTNNVFRNGIDPSQWWAGRMIYFVTVPIDSAFMENNTIVNCGFGFQQQDYGIDYFWCNHNTFVNIPKFAFLNEQWKTAYITNNVFYNCHFTGERVTDRGGQDPDGYLYGAVLNVDTLRQSPYVDSANVGAIDLAKTVVFYNNSNYTEPWFQTYYDTYNADPTHSDPILAEPLMNERTDDMFYWHNNMKRGNIYDGENPSFVMVPTNTDSIIAFLDARYLANGNNVDWGWDNDVYPGEEINPRNLTMWPIVDNLSYTNSTLLAGGISNYPLGDMNWFLTQKASWEAQAAQERQTIKDIVSSVENQTSIQPDQYKLGHNYPNPFNPSTTINFSLPQAAKVKLVIFNLLGQQIRTLVNDEFTAGDHSIQWDGKDNKGMIVGSGIYFYQLSAGSSFSATHKMVLMK
jgi:hypothetical protein